MTVKIWTKIRIENRKKQPHSYQNKENLQRKAKIDRADYKIPCK